MGTLLRISFVISCSAALMLIIQNQTPAELPPQAKPVVSKAKKVNNFARRIADADNGQ